MEEKALIEKVLNLSYNVDGTISTLSLAMRGARELTERDFETGKRFTDFNIENFEKQSVNNTYVSNKLIGIASYLIVIDLIGNIFAKKGQKELKDEFKRTLKHFTDLDNDEINSLKNLRNSIAHKFSLGNESEAFALDYSENEDKLIEKATERYPSQKRNNTKEDKYISTIYFHSVCSLVEDIYKKLMELNKDNQLKISSKYLSNNIVKINDFNAMYFVK